MITSTVNMSGFERGVAGLIRRAGLDSRVVIQKETGELIKTLVRVSPKADAKKIRDNISARFHALEHPERTFGLTEAAFEGKTGVAWYAADSKHLYGIAREADLRDASVEELKALLYKTTRKGRIIGRHGRQTVYIWKKITTRAATVRKLITAKIRNRGRLAAGWLVATLTGTIRLAGSGQPPEFVKRHVTAQARGSFVDGLATPGHPRFTVINFAKGISAPTVNHLVQTAVNIRAKAMQKNTALLFAGKKKLSDYARH